MLRMTASACSGVLHPCSPVRGLWTRSSECWPPFQWMTSTISPAASSISTTISVISARTSRWRVLIVVRGALHAAERFIGQSGEVGTHIVGIRHLHLIEPLPATLDTLQRSLPRLLQLRCDQAIVGGASGIAAFSERCIVLGLLQLQLGDAPPFLILVSWHPFGLLSR